MMLLYMLLYTVMIWMIESCTFRTPILRQKEELISDRTAIWLHLPEYPVRAHGTGIRAERSLQVRLLCFNVTVNSCSSLAKDKNGRSMGSRTVRFYFWSPATKRSRTLYIKNDTKTEYTSLFFEGWYCSESSWWRLTFKLPVRHGDVKFPAAQLATRPTKETDPSKHSASKLTVFSFPGYCWCNVTRYVTFLGQHASHVSTKAHISWDRSISHGWFRNLSNLLCWQRYVT